jgi:hybrid cluster-associated redox disulfide protein
MTNKDINNPDLPLQVLFNKWPDIARVFLSHRMLCFGCPIAPFHTIMDACLEYGLDEILFRNDLNAVLRGG